MNEIMAQENSYYVCLDSENRINVVTVVQQSEEQFLFDFPTGFDFSDIINWKIVDGELVNEPIIIPESEPQPTQEEINKANIEYIAFMTDIELAN